MRRPSANTSREHHQANGNFQSDLSQTVSDSHNEELKLDSMNWLRRKVSVRFDTHAGSLETEMMVFIQFIWKWSISSENASLLLTHRFALGETSAMFGTELRRSESTSTQRLFTKSDEALQLCSYQYTNTANSERFEQKANENNTSLQTFTHKNKNSLSQSFSAS